MGALVQALYAESPVEAGPGEEFLSFSGGGLGVTDSPVYLEFYGLTEAPFTITPNPRFLFYSDKHREAFNHLLYGIRERRGFVQLTGEVGAGKTTLCRALLEHLGGNFSTAVILNPALNTDLLLKAIAVEFGLDVTGADRLEMVAVINDFLLRQMAEGRECVLIVDEAQTLSNDLLEQVRQLSIWRQTSASCCKSC